MPSTSTVATACTDLNMMSEKSGDDRGDEGSHHASAHGQEGDGGGTLTEGGPPRHASALGQEGGDDGATLADAAHAPAHGQDGGDGGALTEGGLSIEPAISESADRLRQAVRDALKLQGDEVDEREVQAYVQQQLGVELIEEELFPIIYELIDEENAAAAAAAAAFRAQNRAELIAHGLTSEPLPPQDLPPECDYNEKRVRKLTERALYHRAWADIYQERVEAATQIDDWLADQRQEFDGETRLTAEDSALGSQAPSLRNYRDKAKRTRDSLPARFYRMIEGEEWDGEAHSYSKARKKYRRWEEPYQQRERERQQRKKRDYSKKKRPADDNARRQARRIAQREREKARQPWRQACPPTVRRATAVAL